jgi:hypothetical protein
LTLRAYFAALIVLVVAAAVAGALYTHMQSDADARDVAVREATFAAQSASKLLSSGVPVIEAELESVGREQGPGQRLFAHPSQCSLSFSQVGAVPTGHVDSLRSDGSVVCSSLRRRISKVAAYGGQAWFPAARRGPLVLAPRVDPVTGEPVAILSAPFPGGVAAAFVDLRAIGPQLALELSGPRARDRGAAATHARRACAAQLLALRGRCGRSWPTPGTWSRCS